MRSITLIAIAALGLAACQPQASDPNYNVNAATPASTETSDCGIASNTLADEKVLFAAETAYNIPADAYVRAMAVPETLNARNAARPYLLKAYDYLKLARTAYKAGDGCSLQQYSDLAKQFGDQAKTILAK